MMEINRKRTRACDRCGTCRRTRRRCSARGRSRFRRTCRTV